MGLIRMALAELSGLMRSTKVIILCLFLIFVNIQVIDPLREVSRSMNGKLSVLEPFIAISNSGIVLLILPLFYIVMMADYPRQGGVEYFFRIRSSQRKWIAGQLLFSFLASVIVVAVVVLGSVILSADFIDLSPRYSDALMRYTEVFPEKAGGYISNLFPVQFYNQTTALGSFFYSVSIWILFYYLLSLVIITASFYCSKVAGIIIDCLLIIGGTIASNIQWVFPLPHVVLYMHYEEYAAIPKLLPGWSYLYFTVLIAILVTICITMAKKGRKI